MTQPIHQTKKRVADGKGKMSAQGEPPVKLLVAMTGKASAAKTASGDDADANSHVDEMARAATHQPRTPVRSSGRADDPHDQSRRNPRRT